MEQEAAQQALQAANAAREQQFQAEAKALQVQMQAKLSAAEQATQDNAIQLASDHIDTMRLETQQREAASFEAQRVLNEQLALLSGSDEEKARRMQQLAKTCEDLRTSEAKLRQLLAQERERANTLAEALEDQKLKASLKAVEVPAPRPLTEEEKVMAAEADRLLPLSDAIRRFIAVVSGSDDNDVQKLPPWNGFTVDTESSQHLAIRGVALTGMRLRGRLPSKFVTLATDGETEEEMDIEQQHSLFRLTTLALGNNRIEGKLPRELLLALDAKELRFLELNDNALMGRIPTELGLYSNLLELKLQYVCSSFAERFVGVISVVATGMLSCVFPCAGTINCRASSQPKSVNWDNCKGCNLVATLYLALSHVNLHN